jgi:hypothetical protein
MVFVEQRNHRSTPPFYQDGDRSQIDLIFGGIAHNLNSEFRCML